MRAIITVIGKDRKGIIAGVSTLLAENDVNILDISQTILQEYFTMMMLVEFSDSGTSIETLSNLLDQEGERLGVSIRIQHEDIFRSMHRI